MSVLASSLRTMHLVESLAVSLYQGPQPLLRQKNPPLYDAFRVFAKGEQDHKKMFADGLSSLNESPLFFSGLLAVIVGGAAYLIAALLGLRVLLHFEMLIERIAIWHYGKILQRGLPQPWQDNVRQVQRDELHHLDEMKRWLQRL